MAATISSLRPSIPRATCQPASQPASEPAAATNPLPVERLGRGRAVQNTIRATSARSARAAAFYTDAGRRIPYTLQNCDGKTPSAETADRFVVCILKLNGRPRIRWRTVGYRPGRSPFSPAEAVPYIFCFRDEPTPLLHPFLLSDFDVAMDTHQSLARREEKPFAASAKGEWVVCVATHAGQAGTRVRYLPPLQRMAN